MCKPELRDKEGVEVELVPVKGLRFRRGFGDIVERLPLYANEKGDWFVELKDVAEFIK